MSVVPPPPLPVLTVMLNVLASPFVNVIVFKLTLAVTNELAEIAELTNPNELICADELITSAGKSIVTFVEPNVGWS
jgi:hypothetical protein